MKPDPRCPLCGYELKVVTVRVPVYADVKSPVSLMTVRVPVRYEEREDVCDCSRCHGAY